MKWTTSSRLVLAGTYSGDNKQDSLEFLRVDIPSPCSYKNEKEAASEKSRVRSTFLRSVPHEDEVLAARSMPQRSTLIASRSSAAVFLHDCRGDEPVTSVLSKVAGVCLAWSKHREGCLLIGTDGGEILSVDVSSTSVVTNKTSLVPSQALHSGTVSSVEWHPTDPKRFVSSGQDGVVSVWDVRSKKQTAKIRSTHGESLGVNCVSFNPRSGSHLFLTGVGWREETGDEKTMNTPEIPEIKLWDERSLQRGCVHTFIPPTSHIFHDDLGGQVYQTRWNPHNSDQFGACAGDGTVRIWDISKIGAALDSSFDALDGPPELEFVHGGHTDAISDFQWDYKYPQTVVSVADDNICMFWRPLL